MMLKIIKILVCAAIAGTCTVPIKEDKPVAHSKLEQIQLPVEGEMPSFEGSTGWLNSKPLTREELRGKVVLVEFWTYSCINWLRTDPYVGAWAEKYKDKGLVVIGVHTPEFEFEKNVDNVSRAAKDLKVDYSIAMDSDYGIWRAFNNRYWPALYFVDAQGRIRHHQFGEGEYELSERVIQKLLAEAGNSDVAQDIISVKGEGPKAAPDWENLRSPENYVGSDRTENFVASDKNGIYTAPAQLSLNQWALSGEWTVSRNSISSNKADGRIVYRFHARDLHLVMGSQGAPVRFRVLIDGQPPGAAHGIDVDEQGAGTAAEPRMYQLIRQPGPIADRQFEIQFLDPGVDVFVFTFG